MSMAKKYAVISYLGDSNKVIKSIDFFWAKNLEDAYEKMGEPSIELKIVIPLNKSNKQFIKELLDNWE